MLVEEKGLKKEPCIALPKIYISKMNKGGKCADLKEVII